MKRLSAIILSAALLAPHNVLAATNNLDPVHTFINVLYENNPYGMIKSTRLEEFIAFR